MSSLHPHRNWAAILTPRGVCVCVWGGGSSPSPHIILPLADIGIEVRAPHTHTCPQSIRTAQPSAQTSPNSGHGHAVLRLADLGTEGPGNKGCYPPPPPPPPPPTASPHLARAQPLTSGKACLPPIA
eukprot:scaffold177_cov57-Isochrysis_galbana.AAC.1